MKITVQFFGILAEVVSEQRLILHDVKSVEELEKKLVQRHPEFKRYLYRVFVNQELISGNKSLSNGDEVAIIPPFAGG